jgi:hypothetical protein
MSELDARPVDPRDRTLEIWHPAYRVYYWRPSDGGWSSREFEVSSSDVDQVLAWAVAHCEKSETYTVFTVARLGDEICLVRLLGEDPTRHDE